MQLLSAGRRAVSKPYQICLVCGLLILFLYYASVTHLDGTFQSRYRGPVSRQRIDSFTYDLFLLLETHAPGIEPLKSREHARPWVFWKAEADTPRPDVLDVSAQDIGTMRNAHDIFLAESAALTLPYRAKTRGIVSTAGGALVPVFLVSLRMLRLTGCTLPVELLVGSREEEPYLCETILPSQNAQCIYLSDYLGKAASKVTAFQYKIVAVLLSSFESLLFLDADCFVVNDPSSHFASKPFTSHGLVTWPDFWMSSASAHLYEIQSLPAPLLNVRASSESGQFFVSKKTHSHALLMAAYYNFHGPQYYFELMSQGAPGQGDKETVLSGAEVTQAGSYQVRDSVDTMGYYEDGWKQGPYHGVAMVQYDPLHDGQKIPFAVHHNFPKLDPVILFSTVSDGTHGEGSALTGKSSMLFRRLWGPQNRTIERFGRDLEETVWSEIEGVTCEYGSSLSGWKAEVHRRAVQKREEEIVAAFREGSSSLCETVKQYRREIFG